MIKKYFILLSLITTAVQAVELKKSSEIESNIHGLDLDQKRVIKNKTFANVNTQTLNSGNIFTNYLQALNAIITGGLNVTGGFALNDINITTNNLVALNGLTVAQIDALAGLSVPQIEMLGQAVAPYAVGNPGVPGLGGVLAYSFRGLTTNTAITTLTKIDFNSNIGNTADITYAAGDFTVTKAGIYLIIFNGTFQEANAALAVAINNAGDPSSIYARVGTDTPVNGFAVYSLAANSTISIINPLGTTITSKNNVTPTLAGLTSWVGIIRIA